MSLPFDDLVVFREYSDKFDESYDVRAHNNNKKFFYEKNIKIFHNELILWGNVKNKIEKVQGFWRYPNSNLSKVVFFLGGKCSCGHKGLKWCRHEHLYHFIDFHMKSNGIFEKSITLSVMKYLAY